LETFVSEHLIVDGDHYVAFNQLTIADFLRHKSCTSLIVFSLTRLTDHKLYSFLFGL
jgi:hypothetical protein